MEKFLLDAISFARKAGLLLLKDFKKVKEYSKRGHSKAIKTIYDKASENLIKKLISKKYPEHSILSEETGYVEKNPEYLWVVDPLDGTGNFVNGNPLFSVSVAFMEKNKLKYGAIYFPVSNEIFFAERGKGAFLNGRRITVSKIDKLEKSYFVTCEGVEKSKRRKARLYSTIISKAVDIRKLGSGSLECAWVASGRAEAYITFKVPPWDVAAGVLLVEEAGGKVSDFKGKKWSLRQCDFLASNSLVHEKILKLIKNI
ncbi:MAG: inositol monophosphatase [Candidatus Aenigmarchaeota archaeon]|nr:inositol monophosphatase [Candidatus Aenigmarchaeota archaeon]